MFNDPNSCYVGYFDFYSSTCSFVERFQMFGIWYFGHCYLFVICDLLFEIFSQKAKNCF